MNKRNIKRALTNWVDQFRSITLKNAKDNLRVYPLARKDNPPKMEFISGSGKAFNTIHSIRYSFYEHLNEVIQKEPPNMPDPETRGLFASIGIEKGKPFAPDARMKRILTEAVANRINKYGEKPMRLRI